MKFPAASPGAMTEFFRRGLISLTIEPAAVEDWATRLVASIDRPSADLCELATATFIDRATVLDILRDFPRTEEDTDTAWAMFCRSLHGDLVSGRRDLTEIVRLLHRLEKLHEIPAHLRLRIDVLEDDFSLAADNAWGTLEEVRKSAIDLLQLSFDEETPVFSPEGSNS